MIGPRIIHTTSFKLSLLHAAAFALFSLVLFALVTWRINGYTLDQIRSALATEVQSLLEEKDTGGQAELAREVDERSRKAESSSSYYLLQSAVGLRLAGNLQPLAPANGVHEIRVQPFDDERDIVGAPTPALVSSVVLDDGSMLAVGRDLADFNDVNRRIAQTIIAAAALCAALAMAGGVLLSYRLAARIDAIVMTSETIMSGDLSRRVAHGQTSDEMDRLAITLNRMLDRIQALMETTQQVSSDIAHDLRTPLARLRQKLEGVLRKSADVQTLRDVVSDAILDLDNTLETFSALLRIAEIEAESRQSGFRKVDISFLVEQLAETYAAVAEDAGHRLECEVACRVIVQGDRDLLTQMFANLVENAIRHCPDSTTITLRVAERDGEAVCEVVDAGPGIPEAERARIFTRFYRLERSRTTPGSGLGLALVAAVAQIHHFEVGFGDGAGTTIRVIMKGAEIGPWVSSDPTD